MHPAGTGPWIWCALAALGAACAHRPPPPLHSARLTVQRLEGGGFRPFVEVKVAGRPIRMLVDTGAYRSILPRGFAQESHLRSQSTSADADVVDGNGNLARMPVLPFVPVQFEGEESGTLDFLMNGSSDKAEGVLTPQDLVRPGGALVIDLEHAVLRYGPEEDLLRELRAGATPVRALEYHRCLDEGLFERAHRVVSVTINGVPADMLIDTGASQSALTRNNPAIPSMVKIQGDRKTTAAMTSMGQGLLVQDVPLDFAGTRFVLPVFVQPVSTLCFKGLVGADVLRRCTLLWGYSDLWAACHAPGA